MQLVFPDYLSVFFDYDKSDTILRYINRMPYMNSNIPSKIFYASDLKFYILPRQKQNMIQHVNLLFIWMKNQVSEFTSITSLWKKIFREKNYSNSEVYRYSWQIYHAFLVVVFLCMCMYFICVYMFVKCVICVEFVCMCICCTVFELQFFNRLSFKDSQF